MNPPDPDIRVRVDAPEPEIEGVAWYGAPALPAHYVRRPRLLSLLDGAEDCPLILVSAPAGSGKTSVVADWVESQPAHDRTGWLTFEPEDDAFWPALIGCLERFGLPVSPASFPDTATSVDRRLLASAASSIASHGSRLTVVVDGYELDSVEVGRDLSFLLRHCGHRLQLVILTRMDPLLPLYRYRLDNTLTEVRMADLRFTDEEAALMLKNCGAELSSASVHSLNVRTEGWAVGLRFAAVLLNGRADKDRAVEEVAGDTGNIAEYLLGEVLDAQTPEVRDLLLSTSIPETLRPGLTEELGGRSAARTLSLLTRANAFVEPVPERPGFYRYHPFFRDLLRAVLEYESPELMESMQRKAADWFAGEGLLATSASHYASIHAWAEAAHMVVDHVAVGDLLLSRGSGALVRLLRSIPDDLVDPAASVVRGAIALVDDDAKRLGEQLMQIPKSLVHDDDTPHNRSVMLAVAVLEAVGARYSADPEEAIALADSAQRALNEFAPAQGDATDPALSAMVSFSGGIAAARQGSLARASELVTAGARGASDAHTESLLVHCLGYLAVLAAFGGRLSRADALATQAVTMASELKASADLPYEAHAALAWVNVERYDLRAATGHVKLAERPRVLPSDPVPETMLVLAKSRVQAAQGDLEGAMTPVEVAIERVSPFDHWLLDELRIESGHLRVEQGEPAVALLEVEGVRDRDSADVSLVMAEAQLAKGDDRAAGESLSRVLVKGSPLTTQVTGWLVEVSRQLRSGSQQRARSALDHALRLAAQESVRRSFRQAPPAVQRLLAQDPQLVSENDWLEHSPRTKRRPSRSIVPRQRSHDDPVVIPVIEDLTKKELEVLGHLNELLTTEEIASSMSVSVNTIRTHVRSILRKLGVSRRNGAVRRARDLGLLPS